MLYPRYSEVLMSPQIERSALKIFEPLKSYLKTFIDRSTASEKKSTAHDQSSFSSAGEVWVLSVVVIPLLVSFFFLALPLSSRQIRFAFHAFRTSPLRRIRGGSLSIASPIAIHDLNPEVHKTQKRTCKLLDHITVLFGPKTTT